MASTISRQAVRSAPRDDRHRGDLRGSARNSERRGSRLAASDKVAVPRSNVPLVERPRVTGLITQATAGHRVTLVCGPSGAGKTMACAAWADAAQDGSVAWLSLDYGDRWPRQLWTHLRLALASTPAVPGEVARELPDPEDDAFPFRLTEIAENLAVPVTLVVDDICDLAGASVLAGVDQLIRHAPPTLRFILSGRHPAGLAVAKLRVGGELAEIGGSDLACTPEEADAYFALVGLHLPPAQRDELLERTQGWMTGLRLAALRAARGKQAASISRISGDEPAVADYLWDEVLASLPADSRLFLLRTSVADVICGDLADALTGGTSGSAILEQLSRENMMIGPEDSDSARTERTEYRFHPMLADMLRARLRREHPGETVRLTRRAARWLAARGQHAQAIRTAARAGDWDFAGRVLADAGPELLVPDAAAELEPVLATFPSSRFAGDAAVAGALAAAGLRTGDSFAAALHLENAQQALGRCGHGQRQRIRTWLQALRLMSAAPVPDGESDALVQQSRGIATQAERAANDGAARLGVGLLWCALGAAELAAQDAVSARQSLAAARRHLRDGRPEFDDRARGWQALAEAVYGDLVAASQLATQDAATDPLAARLCQLAMAHVHLARDEPAAARAALDQCDPDERQAGLGDGHDPAAGSVILSLAAVARARLALADGDTGAARNVLTRLRYRCLNSGPSGPAVLEEFLAPLEADIAVRDGDFSRARLTLDGTRPASSRLAEAMLLLAQGDSEGALGAIEPALAGTAVGLHDQVCALVIAAIAERRLGHTEHATDRLTVALGLAEPQRMYRPFLDGGGAARSALTVLIRPVSQEAAFAARTLQRFDTVPAHGQQAAAAIPLTSSELAVLRFLPSHMTNQEIAEALFLSINTVKTHLRSVYRKLNVTTRREAIARGGKLGLL
ncbi:MAG TPA: LuxR C-terminal-related transcriptional regulator [Streptosporangiaceae bacterium]|nr:LuxR C-terminal-related transcriptional regulator [Streptosporangiaceae bacterium]